MPNITKDLIVNQHNDTELHLLIRNGTFQEIKAFLNGKDEKLLFKMARMVNNKNSLPLHEIGRNAQLNDQEKKAVTIKIIDYMSKKAYKSIKQPVDATAVIKKYNVPLDRTKLRSNLELGCRLVNKVRNVLEAIPTHPQSNSLTNDKTNSIIYSVEMMRYKMKPAIMQIRHAKTDDKTKSKQLIQLEAEAAIKNKVFSCYEAAIIAWHHLLQECEQQKIEIPAELMKLPFADHNLLAIDYPGENAVLCDPFSGKVMPFTEAAMQQSLKGHFTLYRHRLPEMTGVNVPLKDNKQHLEILTFYNPNINKPEVDRLSIDPPRITNFCKFFTTMVAVGTVVAAVGYALAQKMDYSP